MASHLSIKDLDSCWCFKSNERHCCKLKQRHSIDVSAVYIVGWRRSS